ncbi:MAG: gliding motility-associated C-terminal domain-containing protein, partial [Parafilimonas sp.]
YYNNGFNSTRVKNISFAPNNDIFLFGSLNQNAKESNVDAWVMRTTFHGTPLWSKAIGTSADETINSIKNIKNGNYILVGATKYNSQYGAGWIAKIDSSGNPLWSLELMPTSGALSQIIQLDNGDFVAAGILYLNFNGDGNGNITSILNSSNFIVRIDSTGNIIWQRSFYHNNKEKLERIQQISDGNLIATGIVTDSTLGYILKIDQHTGDIIWVNQYEKPANYNYSSIKEGDDKSLEFKTGTNVYYFTADGKFKAGAYSINMTTNKTPIDGGRILHIGSVGESDIYCANIKPDPIVFSVKDNATVLWARTYIFNSQSVTLEGSRIYKNNIYLSGSYKASNISDTTSNEQIAYLLKATLTGKALCFDTSNITFKTSTIPLTENTSYTFTDEGSVTPAYISLYAKNILPVRLLDCTQQTCCNDAVFTKKVVLCNNTSYILPDGSTITKPGFYTSRFTTLTGCDSIFYTILSQQTKINLTLTHDTCLINNQPVTFILNDDSSVHYRWQDGTTKAQFTAFMPGEYWVTAISSCDAVKDSVKVFGDCAQPVFIPSAFTPNDDGLNDVFRIPEISGQHISFFNIYNRYGQLLFHSEDVAKGWDGTRNNLQQPAGTYIYVVRYFDLINTPHLLKGTITLIR